jgi:enoyl-CoA hydratase
MKVLVEKQGPVTTVVINRPEVRNAVDRETAVALRAAFAAFEADGESAVAVLTGASCGFCAGYDLKSLSGSGVDHDPDGEGAMGPSRMLLAKPVLAAVEGHAVFGVYCRRWGVPLIDGGTVRLPRLIGHSRALDMILTGRPVAAEEALAFGLANRLVPAGHARAEAERLAAEIARFPQICLRTDRRSSYQQWGEDIAAALRHEAREGEAPLREEAVAGATRFASGLGRSGDFERI